MWWWSRDLMAPAQASDAAATVIKVGALYPLTGPDAGWAGEPYIKSHQLAIDEINADGGIQCTAARSGRRHSRHR